MMKENTLQTLKIRIRKTKRGSKRGSNDQISELIKGCIPKKYIKQFDKTSINKHEIKYIHKSL